MIDIHLSELIYLPVQQIFDFVSTPENDFQWQYGTLASSRLSEGVGEPGTFFRSVGHIMGRRMLSTFEVTEYEPNRRYCFKSLSGPLKSHTCYTFDLANDGSTLNISAQVNPVNALQLDEAVLEKKMRQQLQEDLMLLKEILEAGRMSLNIPAPII
jgi:hypothetical protein